MDSINQVNKCKNASYIKKNSFQIASNKILYISTNTECLCEISQKGETKRAI